MNFLPIAIGGAIIATIALGSVIKKWRSERKKKETTAVVASVIAGAGTKKDGEKKLTFGQQVKRWWFIIIIVIPVTWVVGKAIWTPTYNSMKSSFGIKGKSLLTASCIWKKKPNQYGYNPNQKTSGYLNATIIENKTDGKFCFTVHFGSINIYYTGKYIGENRIEGIWRNPPDGGKWYLEKDRKNPNFFKGEITDLDLEGWADLELEILK